MRHLDFVQYIESVIRQQLEVPKDANGVPTETIHTENVFIRDFVVAAIDPVNATEDQLPIAYFGYGAGFENDDETPGVNFIGETSTILVFVEFAALRPLMADDTLGDKESLMYTAARIHDRFAEVAQLLRLGANRDDFGISDALLSVAPYAESPSEFETLQFSIRVDWYFDE